MGARRRRRLVLLLLLLATSIVYWTVVVEWNVKPERPDPRDYPDSLKIQRSIVYGQGGGRDLHMDLRFSRRRQGLRKAIVFFHGGGWHKGSYQMGHSGMEYLARHGFLVASVEYRLSDEAKFPAALEDAKCAVRFLRAKQKVLGLDGRSMGAFGHSAGGHLALLLALSGGEPEFEGAGGWPAESSRVQSAVGLSAPIDLAWVDRGAQLPGPQILQFLGGAPHQVPDVYALASPHTHASTDDPPVLLIHGGSDRGVPLHHPEILEENLQAKGVDVELLVYPDTGHGLDEVRDRVDRDLLRHFTKTLGVPPGVGPDDLASIPQM